MRDSTLALFGAQAAPVPTGAGADRAQRGAQIKQGARFVSDTDTEVIPKLCEYIYRNLQIPLPLNEVRGRPARPRVRAPAACAPRAPPPAWPPRARAGPPPALTDLALKLAIIGAAQLVMEVMSKLEGAYGLLVKSAHYPGELVACKRGSPLIMGIREPGVQRPRLAGTSPSRTPRAGHPSPSQSLECGSLEAFLASDASAFVEHTKRCAPRRAAPPAAPPACGACAVPPAPAPLSAGQRLAAARWLGASLAAWRAPWGSGAGERRRAAPRARQLGTISRLSRAAARAAQGGGAGGQRRCAPSAWRVRDLQRGARGPGRVRAAPAAHAGHGGQQHHEGRLRALHAEGDPRAAGEHPADDARARQVLARGAPGARRRPAPPRSAAGALAARRPRPAAPAKRAASALLCTRHAPALQECAAAARRGRRPGAPGRGGARARRRARRGTRTPSGASSWAACRSTSRPSGAAGGSCLWRAARLTTHAWPAGRPWRRSPRCRRALRPSP